MRIKKQTVAIILLVVIFLVTRFWRLTYLPVFADEAIYLRWSQLIISDPPQYLFFPMNDGKTPLQIWLNVPFLLAFSDPLWAGRFVAILVGLGQIFVTMALIKNFGGSRRAGFLGACLVVFLPGWFLYQRLALLDGLLTLCLSVSLLFIKKTINRIGRNKNKRGWRKIVPSALVAGIFFGAALWTKFAALLFLPVILVSGILFFNSEITAKKAARLFSATWWRENFIVASVMVLIGTVGGLIFLTLKITPVFSQIFARGGDFLHPFSTLLSGEIWSIAAHNTRRFAAFLANYATWPFLLSTLALSIVVWKKNRQPFFLLICAIVFLLPMVFLGKVVYPRYLLPALIFITLAGVLAMVTWWQIWRGRQWQFLPFLLLLPTFIIGANFIFKSTRDLARWPLVPEDISQYLTTWSAGFGIPETVELIKETSAQQRVLVLTEGYFGTLPDALLMYFFNQDVSNLAIEGIGQPVVSIPAQEIARFAEFDKILLVVNSNRLQMKNRDENLTLVASFPRPLADEKDGLIDLQVWEIRPTYGQN